MRINYFVPKKLALLVAVFIFPFFLSGCISHCFLESSSRLQIENQTGKFSIVGVDVLADDGSSKSWIREMVLPGERSRVVEEDWVGNFTLRFKFTRSADGSGKVVWQDKKFELDGGSLYLSIGAKGDSLTYKFK